MAKYGADVAELRSAAADFDKAANSLEALTGALTGQLARAPWRGPDSDTFRRDWSGDHTSQLRSATTCLREAAKSLRTNADDQERASTDGALPAGFPGDGHYAGGGGGGGGGGGWGPGGGAGNGSGIPPYDPTGLPVPPVITQGHDDHGVKVTIDDNGVRAEIDKEWSAAGGTVHREGDYGIGQKGSVSTKFNWGDENLNTDKFDGDKDEDEFGHKFADRPQFEAGVDAEYQVGAWAEDSVAYEHGPVEAKIGYDAMVGLKTEAGAGISAGPDGVRAAAEASAYLGVQANVSGSLDVGGVGVGGEVGVRAGIGADIGIEAGVVDGKLKFGGEFSIALGVGFTFKPEIEIDPGKMWKSIFG